MSIQVPASVNVKDLVAELDLSPTRTENVKNKIYYFLSRIVSTNENFHLNAKANGYRKISSIIMRKVMGREDYYMILDLLLDPSDPIIESDNSWRNSQDGSRKGFSKGYRLTEKYNTGEIIYKSLPRKYRERIQKHSINEPEKQLAEVDYQFLLDQFKSRRFTFISSIYNYIRVFGNTLLAKVENEYQRKMVINMIGRWLYEIEKIQELEPWRSVSTKNHRIHSSLTNLNSKLRPFLLCDGQPLGILDVTASHPYTFSTMLSDSFMNDTGSGYNLRTIYPELYEELVTAGSTFDIDSTCTGNCFEYNSTYTGDTGSYVCNSTEAISKVSLPFPFIWGQFLSEEEKVSIHKYRSAPFEEDFYKDLINKTEYVSGDMEERRRELKHNMMFVLFDDNVYHRNNSQSILMFKEQYPGVNMWISKIHQSIGKSKFSYLLQRAESYLVLNVVCRQFHDKYPSAPLFSIHDAILTYEEYLPDLKRMVVENYFDITGIRVGAEIKSEKPNPVPKLEDIEEVWKGIRPIRDRKKFEKVRDGVFTSNIRRGADFLGTPIS